MMKQCETCLNREYKDDLICCQSANLGFALRELLKSIPLIGKIVPDYKCGSYEKDKMFIPASGALHINCRCSFVEVDDE